MYKYLLFAGDTYYPSGGINDFVAGFDTIEEAEAIATSKHNYEDNSGTWTYGWWQIVDYTTLKIVKES